MQQHIKTNNAAFSAALAAGDAVAAVYTPDAQLLAPGSEALTGSEAIAGRKAGINAESAAPS